MLNLGQLYKTGVASNGYYSSRIIRWDYALRIGVSRRIQLSNHYSTLAIL